MVKRGSTMRRSWPQRLVLVFLAFTGIAALATAGGLATAQWILSDRRFVELADPEGDYQPEADQPNIVVPGEVTTTPTTLDPAAPTTPLFLAEPNAANFLITGADSGACSDDDPTIGSRDSERSDTIMVWRVNPDTNQIAVLSFPRDLYVKFPGGRQRRINEAYNPSGPPDLLQEVLESNFGVLVDHYVQVDFCAFRALVDAVGGVEVPFAAPARDTHVAFQVPAGCVHMDGLLALKYVRSRYYQWQDEHGNWHEDGTSDFGRIARQQDFMRRVLAKVITDGLYKPDTVAALWKTNKEYLTVDTDFTVRRMQEFANALRTADPAAIATYRIESYTQNRGGAEVEIPRTGSDNMQSILAVFRGEATLAAAPDQVFTTTPPPATTPPATTGAGPATEPADTTLPPGEPADTTPPPPTVTAVDNNTGVSPDPAAVC